MTNAISCVCLKLTVKLPEKCQLTLNIYMLGTEHVLKVHNVFRASRAPSECLMCVQFISNVQGVFTH